MLLSGRMKPGNVFYANATDLCFVQIEADRITLDGSDSFGPSESERAFRGCRYARGERDDGRMVGTMAVVVQAERKAISARNKAALSAAKARGVQLGRPENLRDQEAGRERGRARRTALAGARLADLRPIIADGQASGGRSRSGRSRSA